MNIAGNYFNMIQPIYDKPTANVILSGEKLNRFQDQEQDNDIHYHQFYSP